MGSRANWLFVFLAAILAALVFFAPGVAWRAKFALFGARGGENGGENAETAAPKSENLVLKAELAKLQNVKSQLPEGSYGYIRAIVLSRYPMNFKNEFLVDAGAAEGAGRGKAVVFSGMLIGRIEKVFENTALVKTVFDSGFETPVRVGPAAADALLKGGLAPHVALIRQDASVSAGDAVYSASPDFPYGLAVGEIKEIKISKDGLFREATLAFSYDVNEIRSVFIAK